MDRIRIVPAGDATARGTKVLTSCGAEIQNVGRIVVTYLPENFVTAELELLADMDPVDAVPLFGPDTLRRSAKALGFALVPVASAQAADDDEFSGDTPLATGVTRWRRKPFSIVGEQGPELAVIGPRCASIMEAMRTPAESFEADLSGIYALALPHSWKPWHVASVAIGAVLAMGVAAQILSKLGG